jgi:hypothetical protein
MKGSFARSLWVRATAMVVVLATQPVDRLPAARAGDVPARNWQSWVEAEAWRFEDLETQPFFCALKRNGQFGEYEIRMRVLKGGSNVAIEVVEEGAVRHTWTGHRNSVFVIRDHRLYYVDFRYNLTGASLVAVDLGAGRVLWRERCRGIGLVGHSGYRNLVNLAVMGEVAVVRGKESLGRYVEVKSLVDGHTVGHRRFDKEE